MEGERTTETLTRWTKSSGRNGYFICVFCERGILEASTLSLVMVLCVFPMVWGERADPDDIFMMTLKVFRTQPQVQPALRSKVLSKSESRLRRKRDQNLNHGGHSVISRFKKCRNSLCPRERSLERQLVVLNN
ncbi:hypothetical protein EVAR_23130_1 [Eumeta japonica]|uniref:Uncharacterized protein n=1 Tax=Eumeta variegata TaxID=151549 RepID=A0A4C1VAN3_EUMVA|nr:hypothetical protein EVAR_23130_1 [Eumeta japonica]